MQRAVKWRGQRWRGGAVVDGRCAGMWWDGGGGTVRVMLGRWNSGTAGRWDGGTVAPTT